MEILEIVKGDYWEKRTLGYFTKDAWEETKRNFLNFATEEANMEIKFLNEANELIQHKKKNIVNDLEKNLEKAKTVGTILTNEELKELKKDRKRYQKEIEKFSRTQNQNKNRIKELQELLNNEEELIDLYLNRKEISCEKINIIDVPVTFEELTFEESTFEESTFEELSL